MNQSPAGRPFAAPTVDQLSVRVIVDSRYERFLPKMTHPFMVIENVDTIPGRQMTSLACEWGLSLHLESQRAGSKAQYLLDFGYTPEIILRNAGGFHLVTAPQDYIDQTVNELEALKPDVIIPMHCSGAAFIETLRRRMPAQLVTGNVGARYTFGV